MTAAEILAAIPKLSALVVGDICLDRLCVYDPSLSEPSRETGIPRIAVTSAEVTPGAGGTVACNLAALGAARVAVLGTIGDDGSGMELERALERRGISTSLLARDGEIQTFTYTKILNRGTGREDLPRLDFINAGALPPRIERRLLDSLQSAVEDFDAILISDQAETDRGGAVTPAMRDLVADLAAAYREKIFFVDSRARLELFRGVIVKGNGEEAAAACARIGAADPQTLYAALETPLLIVTRGPEGVVLHGPSGEIRVPARRVENPVDICGAGDSFSAGAALALAAGAAAPDAARFGNLVASITIGKKGTGTASPEEVLAHAGD